tara:strand:- start:696 stop:1211 length:516 start_codon:yes stop_codon:yes gene_type:complete
MKLIFENWRKYLNEYGARGMGGNLATISGLGRQPMPATMPPKTSKPDLGDDLEASVKAVLHRNDTILLIRNDKGWDLPGGHVRRGENKAAALVREIFEETGLNISDVQDLHMQSGNKHFFCAEYLTDDVVLSGEHNEYKFFDIYEIEELDELSEEFKKIIFSCVAPEEYRL